MRITGATGVIGRLLVCLLLLGGIGTPHADEELIGRSRTIQIEAMELFKELYEMEESALFPSLQQLRIFITQPFGSLVKLQHLEVVANALSLDDLNNSPLAIHRFSETQNNRFVKGAYQHLVTASVPAGTHSLKIRVEGELGKQGVLEGEYTFEKGRRPKFIEVTIRRTMVRFRGWE